MKYLIGVCDNCVKNKRIIKMIPNSDCYVCEDCWNKFEIDMDEDAPVLDKFLGNTEHTC